MVDKNTNIYLVGLMGAGKTTVGRQLARRLGRRFYDSDHEIVARTGVPIPTIFEIEGEAGFRRRESQTIAELSELRGIVMATGGGAVLAEENRLHEWQGGNYALADYQQRLSHIAHNRTLVIENAGHMLHHDQPQAVAALIEDFLADKMPA